MTYYVDRDAGTQYVNRKRFGHNPVTAFEDLGEAIRYAASISVGMTGREVAVIGSAHPCDPVEQSVELYAYQGGVEVKRQGPWIKRTAQ